VWSQVFHGSHLSIFELVKYSFVSSLACIWQVHKNVFSDCFCNTKLLVPQYLENISMKATCQQVTSQNQHVKQIWNSFICVSVSCHETSHCQRVCQTPHTEWRHHWSLDGVAFYSHSCQPQPLLLQHFCNIQKTFTVCSWNVVEEQARRKQFIWPLKGGWLRVFPSPVGMVWEGCAPPWIFSYF